MRVALVNPAWDFAGSIYFGCREPHLPLELGYSDALLRQDGHETLLLDGPLMGEDTAAMARRVADFAPDMTVVTTAPTYLFWRCAQPELRVPRAFFDAIAGRGGLGVAVGPHGSATPRTALRKLGCDVVVRGECEEIIVRLAAAGSPRGVAGTTFWDDGEPLVQGSPHASRFTDLPALRWPEAWLSRHAHHHHRYGSDGVGRGAEVEASRGCPYSCSFCAKIDFRDAYRRRDLAVLLDEIDGLIAAGVTYLYFIDEIFLPQAPLLQALLDRPVQFRGADPHRPVEARNAGSAGRGRLRVHRGRGGEPDRGRTGGTRQEMPHDHRRTGGPPDPRAPKRSVRAGEPAGSQP